MKLLIPLLFPLSLGAQNLQEMGFSQVTKDSVFEIIDRGLDFDRDTSMNGKSIEQDGGLILVNQMSNPKQLSFNVLQGTHKAEVFFLFDGINRWTRTEIDGVLSEDKSIHLYNIYLPSKYQRI